MNRQSRSSKWMLFALVIVVIALAAWFVNRPSNVSVLVDEPVQLEAADIPAPNTLAEPGPAAEREGVESVKVDAPVAAPARATTPPSIKKSDSKIWIHGRVLDLAGLPVADQDIFQQQAEQVVLARSRADGSFECEVNAKKGFLLATSAAFTPIMGIAVHAPRTDAFIVVAPVVHLAGIVVDESGVGLASAQIERHYDERMWSRFPLPLESSVEPRIATNCKTARDGSFSFPRAPVGDGIELQVSLARYTTTTIPAPPIARDDLRIVLAASTPVARRKLTGIVVLPDGAPAVNAFVFLAGHEKKTKHDGKFEIDVHVTLSSQAALTASKVGWQCTVIENFGQVVREGNGDLAPVRIVLGPEPSSIAGRVVDGDGHPLAGCRVGLLDPTPVLSRGSEASLEGLNEHPEGPFVEVATADDGAFEIFGLTPREYRLFAFTKSPFGSVESQPIRPGRKDVELVIDASAYWTNVTGRVLAIDGTPIEGVDVWANARHTRLGAGVGIGNRVGAKTDGLGTFRIERLPRSFTSIEVVSIALVTSTFAPAELDLSRPLNLQVERRCHFRVEGLPVRDSSQWLSARSTSGATHPIGPTEWNKSPIVGSRRVESTGTRVLYVGESTNELVLHRADGTPIEARPVRLVPGEVAVVKW